MEEMKAVSDLGLFLLAALLLCLLGAAILYGTWRGVKWWYYIGSNYILKMLIGTKGLRILHYILGGIILASGVALLISGLTALFRIWWAHD